MEEINLTRPDHRTTMSMKTRETVMNRGGSGSSIVFSLIQYLWKR